MKSDPTDIKRTHPDGFWYGLTAHIIRFRWLWLAGVVVVSFFFATQMSKDRFDNSNDIWFVEGHEFLKAALSR